jgi:hypothetical protein
VSPPSGSHTAWRRASSFAVPSGRSILPMRRSSSTGLVSCMKASRRTMWPTAFTPLRPPASRRPGSPRGPAATLPIGATTLTITIYSSVRISSPRCRGLAIYCHLLRGSNQSSLSTIDHRPSRSIVATGRIWRPWNVLQYLPRNAWQLGNVHRDKECLLAHEQYRGRSSAGRTTAPACRGRAR